MDYKAIIENALLSSDDNFTIIEDYSMNVFISKDYLELFYKQRSEFVRELFNYNETNMCCVSINAEIIDANFSINAEIYLASKANITGNIVCYKLSCYSLNNSINYFDAKYYEFVDIFTKESAQFVFEKVEYLKIYEYAKLVCGIKFQLQKFFANHFQI